MRRRRNRGKPIMAWLLICAVVLAPVLICGERTGLVTETFLGRTVRAAGNVWNKTDKYTAQQWLGRIFSGTHDQEYDDWGDSLSIEVSRIPKEAIGEVTKHDSGTRSKVLIYHTHTDEAYEQVVPAYAESGKWRTNDPNHNIARVGAVLASGLKEEGFNIIHDQTNHSLPKLSTAYSRSLTTMKKYGEEGIDYYIDVHRDAYIESVDGAYTLDVGGVKTAKLALVVGKAEGELYKEKPEFERTYALAKAVEAELNRMVPGICKPVIVRKERFNQHVSPGCLLIEVGHNKNTLAEAENASEILSQALSNVLK